MRSARLVENNQPLELTMLPIPEVNGSEVLIKVKAAGICHSDLHIWSGSYDLGHGEKMSLQSRGVPMPLTMGHEIAGVVEKIGNNVSHTAVGNHVIIYPWIGCDVCDACIQGNGQFCIKPKSLGIYQDGGYAEYVKVPHEKFLVNAAGLNLTSGCTLACSALTAFSAIKKANHGALATLGIVGIGGLGSVGVQLSKLLTNAKIIAIDTHEDKLKLAKEMGADECVLLDANSKENLLAMTNQLGLDTVIDFVGVENTVTLGLSVLKKSGRLIIVGLVGGTLSYPIPFLPMKNLTIQGSYTGSCFELRELAELARRGMISPYISETYSLEEATLALDNLKNKKTLGRSVLVF